MEESQKEEAFRMSISCLQREQYCIRNPSQRAQAGAGLQLASVLSMPLRPISVEYAALTGRALA